MNVLVDTPIWSLLLRRAPEVLSATQTVLRAELTELVKEGRVVLIGPIRQEVLSGIADRRQFDRLKDLLRAFGDDQLGEADYEEAARCHNDCRAAGVAGSPVDFLICAVARSRRLSIFTTDRDFQLYANTLGLNLHEPRERSSGS
jgi:predicted nucleic acid-binding protein